MTDPAATTDRLQISAARLFRTNGLGLIFGVLFLAAVAWPIAGIASGVSGGELAIAVVFIPVLLGASALMFRLGYTQILRARIRLPVIEATDQVIRMRDAAGRDFEVIREQVDHVVWYYMGITQAGRRAYAHLEFYDAAGELIADWDVGVTAGHAAIPWLRNLGIPVTRHVVP